MRAIVFLICFLFSSSLFAQCPGGVCRKPLTAPVKVTKSVLVKTTEVVAVQVQNVQPVRKVAKFRLFRRWR